MKQDSFNLTSTSSWQGRYRTLVAIVAAKEETRNKEPRPPDAHVFPCVHTSPATRHWYSTATFCGCPCFLHCLRHPEGPLAPCQGRQLAMSKANVYIHNISMSSIRLFHIIPPPPPAHELHVHYACTCSRQIFIGPELCNQYIDKYNDSQDPGLD